MPEAGSRKTAGVLVLAALGMGMAPSAHSQGFQFEEFHTWTDLATVYHLTDRWRYDGDYGFRGLLTDRNWTAAYVRPSVRYRAAPFLMLHGGVGLFYNFLPGNDLPELRPFVGVRLLGPRFGGFVVSNYLRLELARILLGLALLLQPMLSLLLTDGSFRELHSALNQVARPLGDAVVVLYAVSVAATLWAWRSTAVRQRYLTLATALFENSFGFPEDAHNSVGVLADERILAKSEMGGV